MTKIALVSHDAGGAEIISHWSKNRDDNFLHVLDGPAISIFARNLNNLNLVSLDDAIKQSDFIICGTSWQSDLEKIAINIGDEDEEEEVEGEFIDIADADAVEGEEFGLEGEDETGRNFASSDFDRIEKVLSHQRHQWHCRRPNQVSSPFRCQETRQDKIIISIIRLNSISVACSLLRGE